MLDSSILGIQFNPDNRKEEILYAALVVISERGLTGTTHRAIADLASIPLGSTTYYFKSIDDIHLGAYKLFQELTRDNTDRLYESALDALKLYVKETDQRKAKFIKRLVSAHKKYLNNLVSKQLALRKIEAAFLHAGLVNPAFGHLMASRQSSFVKISINWFELVGVENPAAVANNYVGLMNHLERCNTLIGSDLAGNKNITNSLTYFFDSLLTE